MEMSNLQQNWITWLEGLVLMNSRIQDLPGDNSEIAIEGNFLDDCEIYGDGTGGCFAYVSSYNQFEILDISRPNDIRLLSTYYAEIARMDDIKVTSDNNWVLVNHELTNSELILFQMMTMPTVEQIDLT